MADLIIGNKTNDSDYSLLLDANLKIKYNGAESDLISDTIPSIGTALSSSDISHSQAASAGAVHNTIRGLKASGRNLLPYTGSLIGWTTRNGVTITNGIATFPTITSNIYRSLISPKNFPYDLIRNRQMNLQVKLKAQSGASCRLLCSIGLASTETGSRTKYQEVRFSFTGNDKWNTYVVRADVTDDIFTLGSGSPNFDDCWVVVEFYGANTYWPGFDLKEIKLESGTILTEWSPAPEDIEFMINNAVTGAIAASY